jgi:hypothetical protein
MIVIPDTSFFVCFIDDLAYLVFITYLYEVNQMPVITIKYIYSDDIL